MSSPKDCFRRAQALEPGSIQESINIRILEKNNNRRGDLFGKLMADVFVALGYEQPHLNIHKTGREIDLSANHRLEPRRAIGECKATLDPIGGADLNHFIGALDAEHSEDKNPVTGYFISLSGFTEPALEQENQRTRTRIITLTGSQVISELVRGRILIPKERATELAGRCCASFPDLTLDPQKELLAHERGWIWAIYYSQGKSRTHFVLIHSDGTPLARKVAEEIIESDQKCGGGLKRLICLNPAPSTEPEIDLHFSEALAAYRQYLVSECGYIQLDGLPADADIGSRRLKLEALFVPLHVDVSIGGGDDNRIIEHKAIGDTLAKHSRIALLAAPGGGKSTLIKRLAVAYADPARRLQIDDNLPQKDWLPLFFRCRELRRQARSSFAELLESLSQRETVRQHALVFRAYVDKALLDGRVLLLVDGLDEISDPGDRAAFVCTLRTTLQAYPGIAIVVTSREAGFRHVAAHLAPVCTNATLSAFDEADVKRLCVAWHREVVADTEKVRIDAEQLSAIIIKNDRIKRLAVNPLLLTTLLLVKRWVGSLPTRRTVLYGKAVDVLLMTWNTEGHEPIPEEEALPQLCYVASAMMLEGIQKVSRPKLIKLLQESRESMPTELGYVSSTVDQFVQRVEERSSLLQMAGHDVEDGQLIEFFEFRHLTFQEFLTARAMVEGWHRDARDGDTLSNVLEPHFEKEDWRGVLPLAAVLGGKKTEALIQLLTTKCQNHKPKTIRGDFIRNALANCLADEASASPETIRAAVRVLVQSGERWLDTSAVSMLIRGKYGKDFAIEARKAFLNTTKGTENPAYSLSLVVWFNAYRPNELNDYEQIAKQFVKMLANEDKLECSEGALGCVRLCWHLDIEKQQKEISIPECLNEAAPLIMKILFSEEISFQCAATWAVGWLGKMGISMPINNDILGRLFNFALQKDTPSLMELAKGALARQPIKSQKTKKYSCSISLEEFQNVMQNYEQFDIEMKIALLVIAWYLTALNNKAILEKLSEFKDPELFPDLIHQIHELKRNILELEGENGT